MAKYDDPRESFMPDNIDKRYEWNAALLNLNNMPIDEYMKGFDFNNGGDTGSTSGGTVMKSIKIYASVFRNGVQLGDNDEASTEDTNVWKVVWNWAGDMGDESIKLSASITTDAGNFSVYKVVSSADGKQAETEFDGASSAKQLISFGIFGVAASDTEDGAVKNSSYTKITDDEKTKYVFSVSINKPAQKYTVTFFNGEDVIESNELEAGDIIKYPSMPDKDEGGKTMGFKWEDESFNGKPMPERNLTIKGQYMEKKDNMPIYYGAVLNGKYDDINVEELQSITVKEAINGKAITVALKADEFYISKGEDEEWLETNEEEYIKTHMYPSMVFIPSSVAAEYQLKVSMVVGQAAFTNAGTAKVNGTEYDAFSYGTDSMHSATVDQSWTYTVSLIK